jgi:hypothetical protein
MERIFREPNEDEPMLRDDEQLISRRLNTMLPADVFYELQDYCKKISLSGMGRWDYGIGLRILLKEAREKNDLLEIMKNIQPNQITQEPEKEDKEEKEEDDVQTFGGKNG